MPERLAQILKISTHTSRVGCDSNASYYADLMANFYSHIPCGMWRRETSERKEVQRFLLTHPVWDVTLLLFLARVSIEISTHTSRVGCDIPAEVYNCRCTQFLLTHPVWDVTDNPEEWGRRMAFLLTHPVWDVTTLHKTEYPLTIISTHTSRVGCDKTKWDAHKLLANFYSHIPCGMWLEQ